MFELLAELVPLYVWRYNGPVKIVNFPENQNQQVAASGPCPHCPVENSYFRPVNTFMEGLKIVSCCRCENCKKFVLVVGIRGAHNQAAALEAVYPLGKPNDTVAEEVKASANDVAEDFAEALRCHWSKSYRASVVMCRRAIQSSAIAFKSAGGRLIDQIDDLFKTGRITESLKEFAHEIRLTGNDGAHPDKDGLADVKEEDSTAIIEFTREYLHHVYVMPAKLKARKKPLAVESSNP